MNVVTAGSHVRTIKLSGRLGKLFGHLHYYAVSTAAEAISALRHTVPGFEKELMNAKDRGYGYSILVGKKRSLSEDELANPLGDDTIRIIPMVLGAKSGWMQVIVGVVLIVVGVVVQYFMGGAPNPISNYLYGMGISMIVGGVIQLLSPQPKKPKNQERAENTPSEVFNGGVNTQAQGNPVPLLYGRMKVGSAVISAAIVTKDGLYIPAGGYTPVGSMGSAGGASSGDQT